MEHIKRFKTKCGAEWFERRGELIDGTVEMVMDNMEANDDSNFFLPDNSSNVCFILGQMVILLRREEGVGYYVAVFDCAQTSNSTARVQFFTQPNSNTKVQHHLKWKASTIISEIETFDDFPLIPIDVKELIIAKI
jgi:hypothetical protein